VAARVDDLLSQMTLEEKAGLNVYQWREGSTTTAPSRTSPATGMFAFVPNALKLIRGKR
jgi:beta-glucosidase